ncbi:MAG: single-stranded DNA-binding protein [Candidatus Binatia bacterium]
MSAERRRNRIELAGTVIAAPERRVTPAGTPVLSFRLRVEADPANPAVAACEIPVVLVGERDETRALAAGGAVLVEGSLTERRWRRGGAARSRYEVVAAMVRLM